MKEVIRSQLFQLFKNKSKLYVLIGLIAFGIIELIFAMGETQEGATASQCVRELLPMIIMFLPFFTGIAAGDIAAKDFDDKTVYYEIMSGRTRRQSYFGRVIVALIYSVIGSVLIMVIPIAVAAVFYGWGNDLTVGQAVLRMFLLLFPVIRLICAAFTLSIIIKKSVGGLITGLICQYISLSIYVDQGLLAEKDSLSLALTTMYRLLNIRSRYTYGLSDIKMRIIYDPTMHISEIAGIIGVSMLFAAVYILVGYVFFHKDDLN